MCEYCGCQALTSIRTLTAEHDTVVDLIGRARTARHDGDVDTLARLCRSIADVLGLHTRVEEHGLFPAMAVDFPEHIAALIDDHRHIEEFLATAADGKATLDPAWPDRAEEMFVLLREHILREQDGVFPAALATLTATQWDTVDSLRHEAEADVSLAEESAHPRSPVDVPTLLVFPNGS